MRWPDREPQITCPGIVQAEILTRMKTVEELISAEDDARIMMRWWWFGPSMTCEEIDRELALMRDAGIGGVEIAFLYPITLQSEEANPPHAFLTPTFLKILSYAAKSARLHGLILDVTLGSGWPYGGPQVTEPLRARKLKIVDIALSAGTTEYEVADDGGGREIICAVLGGAIVPFTGKQVLLREALDDPSQLRLLLSVPTGQKVKRAALGAEGFVLDHYSEAALAAHFEAVGEPLLHAVGSEARACFCDSLEVYHSNWTRDFLAEFERLRGYDLGPHLPALLSAMDVNGESGEDMNNTFERDSLVPDLLHDYAQTLQELFEQKFLVPLRAFAHRHGVASRVQVYGIPPTSLSSYRHVDIPEGESTLGDSTICQPADWTEITPNRFAASAGRYYGQPIISGETWTRLHSPPYAATLLDMKAEADQFFLQGINQIVGHGWCQRPEAGDPSQWVFYAAANFNETNPWHPVLPELTQYLQRICSMMRRGVAIADVAIYLPDHDVMSRRTFSEAKANLHHVNGLRGHIGTGLPRALLAMGYNFDLVDDRILMEAAQGHNLKHKIILLPNITRIPIQTLKALQSHHEAGVWLLAVEALPTRSAGYLQQLRESPEVARLSHEIFSSGNYRRAIFQPTLDTAALARIIPPDVGLHQQSPDIGYVHRRQSDSDLYFFVNTSNRRIEFTPGFRDSERELSWVDPLSRKVASTGAGPIRLEAFESVLAIWDGGQCGEPTFSPGAPSREIVLDGSWTLSIPSKGTIQKLGRLQPWTEFEEHRHFSGEGIYACSFHSDLEIEQGTRACLAFEDSLPITPHLHQSERRNTGFSVFLDTPIMDAAVVFLNGKRIGGIFAPPYRLDLSPAIVPGDNFLEIKVYNRLINELSGRALFDFSPIHTKYGTRFEDIQDFDNLRAAPSGVKGQVKVQFFK